MKAPFWTRELEIGRCPCRSGLRAKLCCSRPGRVWKKSPTPILALPASGFGHPRCYFRSYLSCSQKLSREHIVSHSVLKAIADANARISGAAWQQPGIENIISTQSLASKVLCEAHNNILSPLDNVAGAFVKMLLRLDGQLHGQPPFERFQIVSGFDVERWMLKVYCGTMAAGIVRDHANARPTEDADQTKLNLLLGEPNWPPGWGLYANARFGDLFQITREVKFALFADAETNQPAGLGMILAGFRFFLSLTHRFLDATAADGAIYHLEAINAGPSGKSDILAMTF